MAEFAAHAGRRIDYGGSRKVLGNPGWRYYIRIAGVRSLAYFHRTGLYIPLWLRQFIQLFAGTLIGCTVGRAEIWQIVELWNIVTLAVLSFILLDVIAAVAITKFTDMDLITALFSCAPGGLTDMALIAEGQWGIQDRRNHNRSQ